MLFRKLIQRVSQLSIILLNRLLLTHQTLKLLHQRQVLPLHRLQLLQHRLLHLILLHLLLLFPQLLSCLLMQVSQLLYLYSNKSIYYPLSLLHQSQQTLLVSVEHAVVVTVWVWSHCVVYVWGALLHQDRAESWYCHLLLSHLASVDFLLSQFTHLNYFFFF